MKMKLTGVQYIVINFIHKLGAVWKAHLKNLKFYILNKYKF
jgi:hypothetical protein